MCSESLENFSVDSLSVNAGVSGPVQVYAEAFYVDCNGDSEYVIDVTDSNES
jgi:hypothetical protein